MTTLKVLRVVKYACLGTQNEKISYLKDLKIIFNTFNKNSTPLEPNWRRVWEQALEDHECSLSQWVCIEHFRPDDYITTNGGTKFCLKKNAIPTIFNYLMEVEDADNGNIEHELYFDVIQTNDQQLFESLKIENAKLQQKIAELESLSKNNEIVMNAKIQRLSELKLKQTEEAQDLRKQLAMSTKEIAQLMDTITKLREECRDLADDNNVIIYQFHMHVVDICDIFYAVLFKNILCRYIQVDCFLYIAVHTNFGLFIPRYSIGSKLILLTVSSSHCEHIRSNFHSFAELLLMIMQLFLNIHKSGHFCYITYFYDLSILNEPLRPFKI